MNDSSRTNRSQANATQVDLSPRLTDVDGFYEHWLNAHKGMSESESFELNARLIMVMANQISDANVIRQCIDAALSASAKVESK